MELASIGTISSATVMVNMPFALEIGKLLKETNIGIGLHFNLTQGKPIANPSEIRSIIDESGNFLTGLDLKIRIKNGDVNRNHVELELHAQYTWLYSRIGKRLTHIDSHQEINKQRFISEILIDFSKSLTYTHGLRVYNKSYLSVLNGVIKIDDPGFINSSKFGFQRCLIETYFRVRNRKIKKFYSLPDGKLFTRDNNTRALLRALIVMDHRLEIISAMKLCAIPQ
jgi:hypothetical protein